MKKNKRRTPEGPHNPIRAIIVFMLLLVVIGFGFLFVNIIARNMSERQFVLEMNFNKSDYSKGPYYGEVLVTQNWEETPTVHGLEYTGYVYNNSDHDIVNWTVEFLVADGTTIINGWNGEYEMVDNWIIFTPTEANNTIDAKGEYSKRNFGCIVNAPSVSLVKYMRLTGYQNFDPKDFMIYWVLVGVSVVVIIGIIIEIFSEFRIRKFVIKQTEDKRIIIQTMKTITNLIDAKDPYTRGHSSRVAVYSQEIAKRMGMTPIEIERIFYIALMHDVGKIGVPDDVLNKPGRLEADERKAVQEHTKKGAVILKDFSALPGIIEGAKYHHERFDGKGYPTLLTGKQIPLFARIICIADAYDAMSTDRCYRKRLSAEDIITEMKLCAGTQFDPDIVPYMIEMIEEGFVAKEDILYVN